MINIYKQKNHIKKKLSNQKNSIGGWMQISNISIAEIFGNSNFEWVVIDLEHGIFNQTDLIGIFSALESGNTLPFVRIGGHSTKELQNVLELGAQGIIIPNTEKVSTLEEIVSNTILKPNGNRGIGFSRSNNYGKYFNEYLKDSPPIIIPMIESLNGIKNCEEIIKYPMIDAVFIGPYDLSTSLGCSGDFENVKFKKAIKKILTTSKKYNKACGIHIIEPSKKLLQKRIKEGYSFLAYSLDSVILRKSIELE